MPTLRDYQIEDAKFLSRLKGAALFNEQRTGKTPTAIQTIKYKKANKILIVCPASMVYKWYEECLTWDTKPAYPCAGTKSKRDKLIAQWTEGYLIMSYDTLKPIGKHTGSVDIIKTNKPDAIIIDEAHRLRGRTTATASAVNRFINIPFRMALTGTPVYGKQEEIWNILHFLYPKTFPSYWSFVEKYFNNTLVTMNGTRYKDVGEPKPIWYSHSAQILNKIAVQRKRKDIMQWLPEKSRELIKLPATAKQNKYLSELYNWYETEDLIVNTHLERLLRYRMICNDPNTVGLSGSSPKTEWIEQYIKDYSDENILIFSQFTSYLNILKDKFNVPLISGSTPQKVRGNIIDEFQKGKHKLLLLNMPAASEGVTLDNADTIIFTDQYPPIGMIEQSEDRFVATTPDKANKLHKIYTLVIKDTYDEIIYQMLQQRKSEADVINNFKERRK